MANFHWGTGRLSRGIVHMICATREVKTSLITSYLFLKNSPTFSSLFCTFSPLISPKHRLSTCSLLVLLGSSMVQMSLRDSWQTHQDTVSRGLTSRSRARSAPATGVELKRSVPRYAASLKRVRDPGVPAAPLAPELSRGIHG